MRGIVDRIEENKIVIEMDNNIMETYDRETFPDDIKEGDLVVLKDNKFIIEKNQTENRKEYIDNLFKDLIDKGTD